MYDIEVILEYVLREGLVNVEFWNILILLIMLYGSIQIAYATERKTNYIKFLNKIRILLFKIQALVFLLQLFHIIIIIILDCNILEFLYLRTITFCIYIIWLFFILIIYNEIKNKRDYLWVQLLEFQIIWIIVIMVLYDMIIFSLQIYYI